MEELNKIIDYITNSSEYKKCISLKDKMSNNSKLMDKINKVKVLQKKYIKSNDLSIKKELDLLIEDLNNEPLYYNYMNNLEKVNEMISFVNDELNDYFYRVINDD
ncbi:MAG: YlbF family regulator [Bacilli bacterium]|nr:YlbF family regulator [Bacilli bacterium]